MGRASRQSRLAGGKASYTILKQVEQANGLPSDPGGITTTGTGISSSTGLFTVVCAAHTTLIPGYQGNVARLTRKLFDEYADFNPELDVVELCLPLDTWQHGTNEFGFGCGIVDSDVVDGSLAGAVGGVRFNGAAQDAVQIIGPSTFQINNTPGLVKQLYTTISWARGATGSDWLPSIAVGCQLEGETFRRGVHSAHGAVQLRNSTLTSKDWRITLFAYHGSTDSLAGTTAATRLGLRRWQRDAGPLA